ncbi:MAG: hypothetical protein V4773_08460 [Verrucomicrobiota bacterium]
MTPRRGRIGLLTLFAALALRGAVVGHAQPAAAEQATVIVVAGAPGEQEFAPDIKLQIEAWAKASEQAKAKYIAIGNAEAPEGDSGDHAAVKKAFADEAKEGTGELWIVLIGHGTFDGKEAKLNLRGPDISATEFSEWLKPFKRPIAIVDTTSSSAPFMAKLAARGRVIVTSTRSGNEHNYARFGKFLAEALPDPKSDLDKDGQISLLESFLSASNRTKEFYKTEGRLATEHALLDDNGDGLGTPADWFRGVHATKRPKDGAAADGTRAHQFHLVRSTAEQQLPSEVRARRDKLELQLAELRSTKAKMKEDAYYKALEKILLEIAALYEST